MAQIISITNRKGGVGKSTMASHLAAGLATKGYRVGAVDTDPQGNMAVLLGAQRLPSLYRLLVDRAAWQETVQYIAPENYSTPDKPSAGHLLLISSDDTTAMLTTSPAYDPFGLLVALEAFAEAFTLDVIIIDTAPTISAFDPSIMLAADSFLYVTELDALSLQGLMSAIPHMLRVVEHRKAHLNRDTRVLGIIPNKARFSTNVHRSNYKALQAKFPDLVWDIIKQSTVWVDAANAGQPIYLVAPTSPETVNAWRMVERFEAALGLQAQVSP